MSRVLFQLRFRSNPGKEDGAYERSSKIHQDRDVCASSHLTSALRQPGDWVEPLFNTDGPDLREDHARRLMRKGDVVIVSTRIPKNDVRPPGDERRFYSRKLVLRGDNWLEDRILAEAQRFIAWCNRRYVLLTEEAAAVLAAGQEDRAQINFKVSDDARYACVATPYALLPSPRHPRDVQWRSCSKRAPATAGYMLHLRELWPEGPSCLVVFGMSGPITLGFAAALGEMWPQIFPSGFDLIESEFIFAEITAAADIPLIPYQTLGHPMYWRRWQFAWHRRGQKADWPAVCPPNVITERLSVL
jgi:hypothetical protein